MTKKKALQVLIENAARFASGCGVGIRIELTEEIAEDVRKAIRKLYKDVYGRECDSSDLFNLGL